MKRRRSKLRQDRRDQRSDAHTPEDLRDLLDDDHVAGLLTRIRAIGCLIGTASEIADPGQVSVAGWLVETLAAEAHTRLKEAVESQAVAKTARRRRRPERPASGRRVA